MSAPIKFTTSEVMARERKALSNGWSSGSSVYETWKCFHDALCAVARQHGRVSDFPDSPDFYYSGDWSHELGDGFALCTAKGLTLQALRQFQAVVASHHPAAILRLEGDVTTPLFGLEFLVTAAAIFVAWDGETPEGCKAKLVLVGARLD